MSHATRKERISRGRLLIHMGVELVAGELGKMLDFVHRDCARSRAQRFADFEVVEVAPERVRRTFDLGRARHPFGAYGSQNIRAALNRGALHVVHHAADAAQFLASSGPARPSMHHVRQRRAVTGAFPHAVAVVEIQTTVMRSRANCHLARHFGIIGDH